MPDKCWILDWIRIADIQPDIQNGPNISSARDNFINVLVSGLGLDTIQHKPVEKVLISICRVLLLFNARYGIIRNI